MKPELTLRLAEISSSIWRTIMAKLTKYEKETIILFNEGEDTASIYTFNAGLKKRLALFLPRSTPDLCRQEKDP